MTPLTFAFDALVLVSVADAVTTRIGLRGGGMVETNPLMHWSTRSMARALATKAVGLVFVGACLAQLRVERPLAALLVALVATWYTGWLAWRNWRLSRATRGIDWGISRSTALLVERAPDGTIRVLDEIAPAPTAAQRVDLIAGVRARSRAGCA